MKRIRRTWLLVIFLAAVTSLLFFAWMPGSSGQEVCDIHQGPCSQEMGSSIVTLAISPRPVKAMADLTFTVTFSEDCPEGTPFIDLSMPGMVMGDNRVILEKRTPGVYEGTGVIVRCPSGRRTWQATVTVPGRGAVDFIFDVLY